MGNRQDDSCLLPITHYPPNSPTRGAEIQGFIPEISVYRCPNPRGAPIPLKKNESIWEGGKYHEATFPRPAATTLPIEEFTLTRVLCQFLLNTTAGKFGG